MKVILWWHCRLHRAGHREQSQGNWLWELFDWCHHKAMRPWRTNSHGLTMSCPAPEWSEESGSAAPAAFQLLCVRYSWLYFACNILNKADIIMILFYGEIKQILWEVDALLKSFWKERKTRSDCNLHFSIYFFMNYIIAYTLTWSLGWLTNSRKCYENRERRKSRFTIVRNKDFLKDWKVYYVIK